MNFQIWRIHQETVEELCDNAGDIVVVGQQIGLKNTHQGRIHYDRINYRRDTMRDGSPNRMINRAEGAAKIWIRTWKSNL